MERLACRLTVIVGMLAMLFIFSPPNVQAHLNKYSIQAGAWGDDASRHNLGVSAEIRTHIYNANSGTFDYFWVGDNLADGSFIQFGYFFEPGTYCLKEHEVDNVGQCNGKIDHLANNDARWQWQYWPNETANDFFYGIGPANSVGDNGTWHVYTIVPASNGWSFMLDNQQVDNLSVRPEESQDSVYVAAEKSINSPNLGNLGPVEFRNIAYLLSDGWHSVDSLTSLHGCAVLADCTLQNPYGCVAVGPNHIIAGSGVEIVGNQNLLWTDAYVTLTVNEDPNAVASVTLLSNTTMVQGPFSLEAPMGMSISIQLNDNRVPTEGLLYLFGAENEFHGWSGDVNSTNTTINILMDSNKSINGNWTTDYSNPIIIILILAAILLFASLLLLIRQGRHRTSHKSFTASTPASSL